MIKFEVRNENLIFLRWIWLFNITAVFTGIFALWNSRRNDSDSIIINWLACLACSLLFLLLLDDLAGLRRYWLPMDSRLGLYNLWIRYVALGFLMIPLAG